MPTKCLKQDCTSSGFADKPFLFYKITSVSPDIHPLHRKMTTCLAFYPLVCQITLLFAFYPPVLHFTPCKFTKMHCGIAFFILDVHNKKCNSTISFLPHNLAPVWRVFTHNCYDKGILTLVDYSVCKQSGSYRSMLSQCVLLLHIVIIVLKWRGCTATTKEYLH